MNFYRWISKSAAWIGGGGRVSPVATKAAADCVVQQARADIGVLVTRLTSGELTVAQLEPLMQDAIKRGIISNAALAHGGFDNLTPKILERLEKQVLEQHNYLHNRIERIASNVRATGDIGGRDANTLTSYSNAFRSVYENEVLESKRDIGHTQAKRLLAAVSHCASCEALAAEGWMPIDEMPPIGSDDCGNNCYCVIITR